MVAKPHWRRKPDDARDTRNRIGRTHLQSLGLERARAVSIHLDVNDLARVEVDYFPNAEQIAGVAEELETKRYVLVELKPDNA